MNSDKRIINVVGSMGGVKTTKSSSWEVLKKSQGRKGRLSDGTNNHRRQIIANSSLLCKWRLSLQSQKNPISITLMA